MEGLLISIKIVVFNTSNGIQRMVLIKITHIEYNFKFTLSRKFKSFTSKMYLETQNTLFE